MKFRDDFSFFEVTTLMNALFAFFSALLTNFILIIISKIKSRKRLTMKVRYSIKKVLLIPFFASIIYSILIIIGSSSFMNALHIWSSFFPLGIVLAIISINFFIAFNNVYKVILYYIFSILFCVTISNIPLIIQSGNFNFNERFFRNLILSIVLFGVYYLFIITVVHLYYLKLTSKQEKSILAQQSLESQLNYQQLKNQLSPHFLFNNINVLTSLIEENPKKAVKFSENLSHIYRYFLEQEKQDVVLVKDEITFAKSYLELLKYRFELGLNFSISIDEHIKEKHIVSTILQQVLENVVKHNTINETEKVEVKILSKENYLIVENNKNPKLKAAKNSQKGIDNIKKRIAFFTDEKVVIENTDKKYIIKLPILETV
ncbi:sensor histidine kinase [Polaribacter aestuariivivens]|uniref:sensor histidine kinase n=1 Tax=Polaribacter aestuariivivens TaxID=2304626 RepID=UPI003F490D06